MMCTVSMVADHYRDNFIQRWPHPNPIHPLSTAAFTIPPVSREEFNALKAEVEDMKKLLLRAKDYDERNGEPHCEMEEKVALLKKVAEAVGVNLDEVFDNGHQD
jgi:hypothetical protein